MATVTLWLLISIGGYNGNQVVLVERFPNAAQCEHVRKSLPFYFDSKRETTRCIEAKVVLP